jgi:hypothetical protein
VYVRRFDREGRTTGTWTPEGNSFVDNADASVAMNDNGDFVVTWARDDPFADPSLYCDVIAQTYRATGDPVAPFEQGTPFRVPSVNAEAQLEPSVALRPDGGFVATWISPVRNGTDHFFGVFGREIEASGVPDGDQFAVSGNSVHDRSSPSVSVDRNGDLLFAWGSVSYEQDGSSTGVYARRYLSTKKGTPDTNQTHVAGVNVANGNLAHDAADISLPGIALPLTFNRHYDSQNTDDIGLGEGWVFTYGDRLIVEGTQSVMALS